MCVVLQFYLLLSTSSWYIEHNEECDIIGNMCGVVELKAGI